MSLKRRMKNFRFALVAAGALGLSTLTGAEARPVGLLLGGGFHHLGAFSGFHHLGGFGGGFRPGFGGGFHGGAFGFRQAGVGYPGFHQGGGLAYGGFGPAGDSRRWRGGSGRGRYWGAYGAAAAIGAAGAYSYGYPGADSDNGGYAGYGRYRYPADGY